MTVPKGGIVGVGVPALAGIERKNRLKPELQPNADRLFEQSLNLAASPLFTSNKKFDEESDSMPTLYIETSIVSYLRQKASPQIVAAARQLLTRKWWDEERINYELVISQYVLDEAAVGDPELASERLQSLDGIPLLSLDPQIGVIANEIMARAILPPQASIDALHIALVAHHKVQYLLTWNCKHIANAKILPRIHRVLTDLGCSVPIICTPEEMVNDDSENN